jgi:hypothetical protein
VQMDSRCWYIAVRNCPAASSALTLQPAIARSSKEVAPTDRTGLLSLREIFVTDDLRSYAYTAYYQVSSLFVSEGKE